MATTIFIRTHFFDDTIKRLYEKWSRILPGAVTILMDDTRGSIDTAGLPKVSFDLAELEKIGLPAIPPGRTAWFCGDYVMGTLGPRMADDDFAIVVENDAVPGIADVANWRSALDELSRHDLAVSRFRMRGPKWKWHLEVQNIYGPGRQFGALVVLLGFTKATATHMTARRVAIAEARQREGFEDWPNCEVFVGAEAKRAGLRVADFELMWPALGGTVSTHRPYWFDDIVDDDFIDTIYHPATNQRDKYIAKIGVMMGAAPADELDAKLARLGELTPAEQRRLDMYRRRSEQRVR